ncbi:MAG: M14 family metallopeptidase [Bacillota bacterium]
MKNLLEMWTKDGLLRDQNGDGVIDGTNVFINLPEHLAPEGLIDFCARLGFETTSLSFDFFGPREGTVEVGFEKSDFKTDIRIEAGKLLVHYKNEAELSMFLKLLASIDDEQDCDGCIAIELRDGKPYAGRVALSVVSGQTQSDESHPVIDNLSELWSFSGVGKNKEASPGKSLSMNIEVEESLLTTALLRELCYFAARSAMYSTRISFPVTGEPDASLQIVIGEGPGAGSGLGEYQNLVVPILELLDSNVLSLKGSREMLPSAMAQLARSKHWSEGGSFGYWEKKQQLSQKSEAPLLFEMAWKDDREVDLAFQILTESESLDGADVEVFLSEPFEIRQQLEQEWKGKFPGIHSLVIRSAFKTGLHWMMEEVLPEWQASDRHIHGIEIKVQKETGEKGLELPIRWIQELYPIDRCIEDLMGLKASQVYFKLEEDLGHTYEIYGINEQGDKFFFSHLDVPVSSLPYVDGQHMVYPVSSAVRIHHGVEVEERLIQTDRERFYRFYVEEVLPKLWREVSYYRPGQGHTRPLFDRIEVDVWMSEEEKSLQVDKERVSSLEALHEDLYFNTLDYFAQMGEEVEGKPFSAPGGVHPFMHIRTGEKPEAEIKVYGWEEKSVEQLITKALVFHPEGALAEAIVSDGEREFKLPIEPFEQPSEQIHPDVKQWMETGTRYRVMYPDYSYGGHAIPVVECFLDAGEEFYSPLKMSVFKKTLFIEAGHHSNEVSSTPAILALMDKAGERFGDWLKHMNVVFIPLANPDGYQLLTKLTTEHPEWKHHAARFNAVGLEFAHVRFQETVFGEANIYPEILRRWAPDIIIDDHGIPAHEWVQPFAGYNSPPRFPVSYFLPSAHIYGIGRVSTDETYRKFHEENLEEIVSSVSKYLIGTSIESENNYWKERFIKYGNQWLPDVFPIEEAPGIHFYRQTFVTPNYASVGITRYPDWIAADIISEAADEVVYGEALQSCIDAHIEFDLAIIDVLLHTKVESERSRVPGLSLERIRPIKLDERNG